MPLQKGRFSDAGRTRRETGFFGNLFFAVQEFFRKKFLNRRIRLFSRCRRPLWALFHCAEIFSKYSIDFPAGEQYNMYVFIK